MTDEPGLDTQTPAVSASLAVAATEVAVFVDRIVTAISPGLPERDRDLIREAAAAGYIRGRTGMESDVDAEQQVQAEFGGGLALRAELVTVMKRGYSMRGDGLLANMADAVIAAGWVPLDFADAAVMRGMEGTAGRIVASIAAKRVSLPTDGDQTAMGMVRAGLGLAEDIARETR